MNSVKVLTVILLTGGAMFSQNDLDAIRYSRGGIGGTSRFISMGGAFGAVGADVSTAAYNPAGLGLFRRGEASFTGGLKFTNNTGTIYKNSTPVVDAKFIFSNFGIAIAWESQNDPESRNVLAFSNTQLVNYFNSTRLTGYTNSSSIAKDMLTLANQNSGTGLNNSYEGLGYNTYLLDFDSASNQYYSFLDTKRTVKQTRDILNSGRMNELNFSYAYSYKDKYYLGASLGIPRIEYQSGTTHTEADDRDSMRITMTPDGPETFTSTYIEEPPYAYTGLLGFSSLRYEEYFKTTGSGLNLKIGGVARVNDVVRAGLYYHTPTIYRLTDEYYNSLSVAFDNDPGNPIVLKEPENGGYFKYRVITPGRIGGNLAFLFKKKGLVAIDYEFVNYKNAQLGMIDQADFTGINATIKSKYNGGHNVRIGGEYNISPIMLRAGYAMYGGPFGTAFSGDFVRHTISAGIGLRRTNFYIDLALARTLTNENYFLFSELLTSARIRFSSTVFTATAGFKF
jgi:hypothetical protein